MNGFNPTNSHWLVVYLPILKMMEFVSWDDEIPFPTEWTIIIQPCSSHYQAIVKLEHHPSFIPDPLAPWLNFSAKGRRHTSCRRWMGRSPQIATQGLPPVQRISIDQWEIFRIQLMEVRKRTIFQVFCGDIPWNLGLRNGPKIYGRYLQFGFLSHGYWIENQIWLAGNHPNSMEMLCSGKIIYTIW